MKGLSGLLMLGVCLAAINVSLSVQPSWAQAEEQAPVEDLEAQLEGRYHQLLLMGRRQTQQRQSQKAIEIYQESLTIARQLKRGELEAPALLGIGLNYQFLGQPQQALDYYKRASSIFQGAGDRAGEASVLYGIGSAYRSLEQPRQALETYKEALQLYRQAGNQVGESTTLNQIDEIQNSH